MAKFTQGDICVVTDRRDEGSIVKIENWRGGSVAPYVVRVLKSANGFYEVGQITYLSGRDMELKEMQGKKKVYCCVPACNTYSFESKGTIQWECGRHCPVGVLGTDSVSLEQKVDLLLEHLGLEVTIEPQRVVLTERKAEG